MFLAYSLLPISSSDPALLPTGAEGKVASRALLAENARYLSAYATLLHTAVARLQQLDAIPLVTNPQLDEFSLIWGVVIGAQMVQWPGDWPENNLAGNIPLYEALDAFMAWFVTFNRGPSHVRTCVQNSLSYLDMTVRAFPFFPLFFAVFLPFFSFLALFGLFSTLLGGGVG